MRTSADIPNASKAGQPATPLRAYLILALAAIACLAPFCGKAFHMDDPLFVWTAQQIAHHPLDPYGFRVVWYVTAMPMSAITKNPPLASYYGALASILAGWSETAWHIAFLLPALALVLGTYRLAQRFTASPLLAAFATLFAPAILVSATGVMCDVLMLALWIWAVIFWLQALDSAHPIWFLPGCLLIAACLLTKYFGVSLILLLPAYSLLRERRVGRWIWYLLIPVASIVAYQLWTKALYGRGLFWDAAQYARSAEHVDQSRIASALVGMGFLGGCILPVLLFAPILWKRWHLLAASIAAIVAGIAVSRHWITLLIHEPQPNWPWIGEQFGIYFLGGILVLALAASDLLHRRDAESVLLALWIAGTFVFAALLNWTVNARSILPLIPAASILLARRWDDRCPAKSDNRPGHARSTSVALVPLTISAVLSLSVAAGDAALANSGRFMATAVSQQNTSNQAAGPTPSGPDGSLHGNTFFQGHWGFQYYMQSLGARPVELGHFAFQTGDRLVTPENTTNTYPLPPQFVASQQLVEIDPRAYAATMAEGAGFYSSVWGPLPFAFERAPHERYLIQQLRQPDHAVR